MASIYKRGKTWWVHYYVNGKSVDRSLRTRNERVARDRKKRLEAADVVGQLDEPSSTPIEVVVQDYCQYLVATRPRKSAKNDSSNLRAFFGPCCPALHLGSRVPHKYRDNKRQLPTVPDKLVKRHVPVRRLEQITAEMINQYLLDRVVEDGLKPKTVNRLREVLRGLFNFAVEHKGYVCPDRRYRNPVEGVRRHRESAPVITWLKVDDIETQLRVLDQTPILHVMVATFIFAGLRREEAMWLTPADVDLDRRLLRVRAKTIRGEAWQPKTGRNRVVPIGDALLSVLRDYEAPANRSWFFLSPGGTRWHPDNFSAALRQVNDAHGLTWSCLDYRHTFGSHLAQRGMSLFKIAELMGNSPEICRRHYAALVPEQMHEEINFLEVPGSEPASPHSGEPPMTGEVETDGTDGHHGRLLGEKLRLVR